MTLSWVLAELTSKCLVSNIGFRSFIPYRKKQVLINTWHGGGAYKKTDMADNAQAHDYNVRKINQYTSKCLTCFLSSSNIFSQIQHASKEIAYNKFLAVGMPRNDIFFNKNLMDKANKKIREIYNFDDDDFILLYAPTFRGKFQNAVLETSLNVTDVRAALRRRFERPVKVLFRGHYALKGSIDSSTFDFNVSGYPNMQDLLCCADILITDYSSSMWDFSFTGKPCFLFTPDLEEYNMQRGFYTDPYSWGFPIARSNKELVSCIAGFDVDDFSEKMKRHHSVLGSYEDGHATEKALAYIIENMGKKD